MRNILVPRKQRSRRGERARAYIWPTIALRLCLLLALRARQQRRVVQRAGARVELLLPGSKIGNRGREVVVR